MGLDWGERRIGVAMTDSTGMIASPLETIDEPAHRALDRIAALAREYEVARIVVGLPIHMDGRRGPEVERVRAFAKSIAQRTQLPVELLDERWSSKEAERVLDDAGVRRKQQKGRVDPIAAALILRTWLALQRP